MIILFVTQLNIIGLAQQGSAIGVPHEPGSVNTSKVNINTTLTAEAVPYDSLARYPGGDSAFQYYLMRNLTVPPYYTRKIDVSILVTFTVTASGQLKNLHASDAPGPLKREAIQVIKSSGDWIPAFKNGNPVASERIQKISFLLNH